MGDGLDTMKYCKEKSTVKNGAPTTEVGLTLNGDIAGCEPLVCSGCCRHPEIIQLLRGVVSQE